MDLSLNADQTAILDALDVLIRPSKPRRCTAHRLALTSAELDRELAEGGFLDVGPIPTWARSRPRWWSNGWRGCRSRSRRVPGAGPAAAR